MVCLRRVGDGRDHQQEMWTGATHTVQGVAYTGEVLRRRRLRHNKAFRRVQRLAQRELGGEIVIALRDPLEIEHGYNMTLYLSRDGPPRPLLFTERKEERANRTRFRGSKIIKAMEPGTAYDYAIEYLVTVVGRLILRGTFEILEVERLLIGKENMPPQVN